MKVKNNHSHVKLFLLYNAKTFEQIHKKKNVCRMYNLAMILSFTTTTNDKNIDKILGCIDDTGLKPPQICNETERKKHYRPHTY